jgi:hypothetical protein
MKSLRMVFYRDVDGEDVAEERAIFRAIFDASEIKDGNEIVFDLGDGGRIDTYLRGKSAGRIVSPALSWALQDAYLGMDPIEDNEEKARMIKRLPQTVLQPEPKKGK